MQKHTKGPWIIQSLETNRHGYDWKTYCIRSTPENYCIAVVGEIDRATDIHNEANARLIAAAPELLIALEGAQSALRKALPFCPADAEACYVGEWLDEVNEAIAKAKGGF